MECKNCKFHDNDTLECFRFPPQIMLSVDAETVDIPGFKDERNFITRFPRINNYKFCGEFKKRNYKSNFTFKKKDNNLLSFAFKHYLKNLNRK